MAQPTQPTVPIEFNKYAVVHIVQPDGEVKFESGSFHYDKEGKDIADEMWHMEGLLSFYPHWYFESKAGQRWHARLFGAKIVLSNEPDGAWHKHLKPGQPVCTNLPVQIVRLPGNQTHNLVVQDNQLAYLLPRGGMARLNMSNQGKTCQFVGTTNCSACD
jgi:hypothetical protein